MSRRKIMEIMKCMNFTLFGPHTSKGTTCASFKSIKSRVFFPLSIPYFFRTQAHLQHRLMANQSGPQWTWQPNNSARGRALARRSSWSWSRVKRAQCSARPSITPALWSTCSYLWTPARTSCSARRLPPLTGKAAATASSPTGKHLKFSQSNDFFSFAHSLIVVILNMESREVSVLK